ncbi:MAG: ROK family protein [Caldithrix sp.]|nr:ROK family protein [Caldithrix sp.]
MIKESGFGPKLLRQYNELNILRLIKNEGPLSRADLAKRYKISKAAVSEISAHLIDQGYITEFGTGNSTSLGGRKPILLKFNPKSGYVIGIEIRRDHAYIALSDLNAKIYRKETISFPTGAPLRLVCEQLFNIIDDMQNIPWVRRSRPLGIGVAIPGLINYTTGAIQESDTLKGWQGFPIKKVFEERYHIETVIENDVKSITLGEFRFGYGKNYSNIIYLWIGDGLSAGIIIDGKLYRGISASAGEIGYYDLGYLVRQSDAFKLLYTNQENFADILSERALLDGTRRAQNFGLPSIQCNKKIDIQTILRTARENHPLSVELLREYGSLVGIISIQLINTLNPQLILVGGHQLARDELLLQFIKERVKEDILRTPSQAVKIRSAMFTEEAGIFGAIGLILEDLFFTERLNVERYQMIFRT